MTLGFLLTVGVGGAAADSECVQDAKVQRGQCRTECDENFVIARDLCRNIDPECAAGCRSDQETCRAPIVTALETCVDGCRDRLNAERAACPRRGRGRDFCLDRAQVRAFLCRDDCRESLQVRAGLKACRDAFNGCMAGCGLPPEPAPPVPTAGRTEPPPQPTPVKTEVPEPTAVPTEPPPPPTPTRTATPKPQPTVTFLGPR
jgi:hypothetical protein